MVPRDRPGRAARRLPARWHGHCGPAARGRHGGPADQVGRSSVLVLHYRRAVYSGVQAELVEEYRDMDTTGKGDKNTDAMEPRADTHRRNMRWALSDLLGQPRTTVELI